MERATYRGVSVERIREAILAAIRDGGGVAYYSAVVGRLESMGGYDDVVRAIRLVDAKTISEFVAGRGPRDLRG